MISRALGMWYQNKNSGKWNAMYFYDSVKMFLDMLHKEHETILEGCEHKAEDVHYDFDGLLDVEIKTTPTMDMSITTSFFNGIKGFKYEPHQDRHTSPDFMITR